MTQLKQILTEGIREKAAECFLRDLIKGTQWENKVFAAGGYVRDEISGRDPKDLDVVVDYPEGGIEFAKWITKKIGNYKDESNPVIYPRFGTAKFHLNGVIYDNIDLTGFEIESVMPRSEEYTHGSRKPDVSASSLSQDAFRRDTTFNSLFKNISTGEILDFTGKGIDDLNKGVIRTPIDPNKTFIDDPLRMLRVVRFFAKYNYKIPQSIIRALKKNAAQIENISAERIQDEINKILITTNVKNALRLLKITGLLEHIIPEFKASYNMTQNRHHNEKVFDHILSVLQNTKPNLITRLQALFHDIGKTTTRSVIDNEIHFYKHEDVSAEMAKEILTRLKYPTDIINAVALGVRNHMRLKPAGKQGDKISDKALRKFVVDLGDQLESTLDLMDADNRAHAPESAMPDQIPAIINRLNVLKTSIPKKGEKLPITGNDLISLGLSPGPLFTRLLNIVKDKQLENPNTTREEYIDLIKNIIKHEL
jgi:putative nucleotidyltransferase with HDIG domain